MQVPAKRLSRRVEQEDVQVNIVMKHAQSATMAQLEAIIYATNLSNKPNP
jgi:hypothetical protein